MDTLTTLAIEILDHACGNLSDTPGSAGNGESEIDRYNAGYQEYTIEVHCVRFKVNARKVDGEWQIRDWTAEDC